MRADDTCGLHALLSGAEVHDTTYVVDPLQAFWIDAAHSAPGSMLWMKSSTWFPVVVCAEAKVVKATSDSTLVKIILMDTFGSRSRRRATARQP